MKQFNNFTLYTPEAPAEDDTWIPTGVLFLRSDAGVDWYAAQAEFSANTLKVVFDSAGMVCCVEKDASAIWPIDCSVVEISPGKLPEGFVCDGSWVWNGKAISPKALSQDEIIAKNEAAKSRLMNAANLAIAPLQDAFELGDITEDESAHLLELKRYRVKLSRVDTRDPTWPPVPQ